MRSEEHTSELQSHDNLVCRIIRSEEHTSELQSHDNLVCRLLLEKKKKIASPETYVQAASHVPCCTAAGAPCARGVVRLAQPCHRHAKTHLFCFFFFNDTATTEIYTLSLHDALPISNFSPTSAEKNRVPPTWGESCSSRSEEHTSELQSHDNLVCRLLLEKKQKRTPHPQPTTHHTQCRTQPHGETTT